MRAIEYGFQKFGYYSFHDTESNVYVFNDKIAFEQNIQQQPSDYYFKEVQFSIDDNFYLFKSGGGYITLSEFQYLTDTGITIIEEIENQIFSYDGYTQPATIYKIENKYYVKTAIDLEEVIIESQGNGSQKVVPGDIIILNNKLKDNKQSVIFFISSNGALLERAFQSIDKVFDNELVIFLETQEGTNLFGTVVRVKSGNEFKRVGQVPLSALIKVCTKFNATTNEKVWHQLFEAHFKDKNDYSFIFMRKAFGNGLKLVNYVREIAFDAIGTIAEGIEKEIFEKLKIKDSYWQYYDKDGKPLKENKILLPIDSIKSLNDIFDEKAIKKLMQPAIKIAQNAKDLVRKFLSQIKKLPKAVRKMFEKFEIINKFIDFIIDYLNNPLEKITNVVIDYLVFLNAFIVGLLNGIIDAIKGLFELIKMLAYFFRDLAKKSNEMVKNIRSYSSLFFEMIENGVDFLINLFTIQNFKALMKFQVEMLMMIFKAPEIISNFINNQSYKINIDKFAYGFGYVVGNIIEMILEILFTGGAKTIAQATTKFIAQIDDLIKLGGKAIRKTAALPVDIFDKIVYFARAMDEFAKNLPKHIDDFSKSIKNFLENVRNLIKEIWETLTKASRERLEKWGLKPTKLEDNILSLCPINS